MIRESLRKGPTLHSTGSKEAIKYSNRYMGCENKKTVQRERCFGGIQAGRPGEPKVTIGTGNGDAFV